MEITSVQNDIVKYVQKLQNTQFRKSEKMILIDGTKSLFSILEAGLSFEYLFLKKDCNIKDIEKIIKITKKVIYVNDAILKKISTTKTPTAVVGVVKEPFVDKNIFKKMKKIALIDSIKDAGNLGTIIRSACAFGLDGIILFSNCVDLYNTKTIRSSAQNIFKIPVIKVDDINFIKSLQKNHKLYSFVVDTDNDFISTFKDDNYILAFGSEAEGLSDELVKLSDYKVTFPMKNDVESLNLGICAGISFALIYYLNKNN